MSDQNENSIVEQQLNPTPVQVENTQPQAVTVDMEAINKAAEQRAERAAQTVVKDMLKQQGLDDEAIKGVLADWKSKQTTPEQALAAEKEKTAAAEARAIASEEKTIALSKGVPIGSTDEATTEKVTACMTLAKSYVTADVTFDVALEKALKIIRFEAEKTTPKPMWGGSGKNPTGTALTEKEIIKRKYLGLK